MIIDYLVLFIYLTFILDFLVWPIASEVSTAELVRNGNVSGTVKRKDRERSIWRIGNWGIGNWGIGNWRIGNWGKQKLLLLHAVVLVLWLVPALLSLSILAGVSWDRVSLLAWTGLLLAVVGRVVTISGSLAVRHHGLSNVIAGGIFSVSRHPILLGLHISLAGLLLTVQIWLLIIPYVLTLLHFHQKVHQEEQHLLDKYGEAYAAYCQKTPRYLVLL